MQKKLIVILGPTASGKSELGVQLAKKFSGEIISADSRQVYKGMNIGSGKITKKEMQGIPHHLLDVCSPKRRYTVADYKKKASKTIQDIHKRDNLPFLVGGSPLYIYSVVDDWVIPEVPPNEKLRKKLEQYSTEELFKRLHKLDPKRAKTIESKNKRRLIRALEIILSTKKPVPPLKTNTLSYSVLFLGTKKTQEELQKRISRRLNKRFKQGMIAEIKRLHSSGVPWKRLEEFGLEYRFIAQYLQKKLSLREMKIKLEKAIVDFSKRQMTWFKKDQRIRWTNDPKMIGKAVHNFLA